MRLTRLHNGFDCDGAQLVGTLDRAAGKTGLMIVSGGNELRSGAWAGQAQLAARVAAAGHPVFRFDRRGIGDSEGTNAGFRGSLPDIKAAIAAFLQAAPQLTRIIAFGNCDAATALLLGASELAVDGFVLANPWTIDGDEAPEAMPAAVVRSRYLAKLANPREVWRLLSGGVDLRKLAKGLRSAATVATPASPLVETMRARCNAAAVPVQILLASRDRTAQMFTEAWPRGDTRVATIDSGSHSFSDETAREWLFERLLAALA
jgi:exosortase A-associated hydrolase 1